MPPLPGSGTDEYPLLGCAWVRDLEYYDGPLLSEYRDAQGNPWLRHWVDSGAELTRWLVYRVTEEQLGNLTPRIEGLREIVQSPFGGLLYVVDAWGDGEPCGCSVARSEDLPDDYVPGEGT